MAVTTATNKLLQDDEDPNQQGLGGQPGSGLQTGGSGLATVTGGTGSASSPGGAAVSTAGAGKGGMGGWVNLQAYLNANEGNTASADALDKEVGKTIGDERSKLDAAKTQDVGTAKSQVEGNRVAQDQASKIISEAAQNYGSDAYNQSAQNLQSKLKASYTGPNALGYTPGAEAQNYQKNLATDDGLRATMDSLYDHSAGGKMTTGQKALQRQLDSGNGRIEDVRQRALEQLTGLSGEATQAQNDVSKYASEFGADQGNLNSYLGGESSRLRKELEDATSSFNQTTNGGIGGGKVFEDATIDNVPGLEDDRKRLNFILDALGMSDKKVGVGVTAPNRLPVGAVTDPALQRLKPIGGTSAPITPVKKQNMNPMKSRN